MNDLTDEPLVSVIIDNYNYSRFLPYAIDSVFSQTYQNFELIIVDDGSTDHSNQIINSYCQNQKYHNRIIPIFQENSGQGGACNAGFDHARGEIICFLDADDYYHPKKLEKVVQSFFSHPNWIQVAHCWISVNSEGMPIGRSTSNVLSQGNVQSLLLKWGKYASGITSALAYRRQALELVMPVPARSIVDSYLNASVPFYGEVGCINQPLMYYRMHGKNMQAYNSNMHYLVNERREIAKVINQSAEKVGVLQRFDLKNDVDFRAYRIVEVGQATWAEKLQIIQLSIQESMALRRSLRDSLIRLVYRSVCVLFPREATTLLGLGFRRYIKQKLQRKAHHYQQ
ncbi:MAG: glycosyltransferase [Aphanocapsa sp. GSE-SYN-MK-11-07L]|jgi:glycosyltransferase involved in cell wall biosynthesis|nr:glycosyltransferase [Aphanocapsa sp. GSE-SYN-MK-11-07L]